MVFGKAKPRYVYSLLNWDVPKKHVLVRIKQKQEVLVRIKHNQDII